MSLVGHEFISEKETYIRESTFGEMIGYHGLFRIKSNKINITKCYWM